MDAGEEIQKRSLGNNPLCTKNSIDLNYENSQTNKIPCYAIAKVDASEVSTSGFTVHIGDGSESGGLTNQPLDYSTKYYAFIAVSAEVDDVVSTYL